MASNIVIDTDDSFCITVDTPKVINPQAVIVKRNGIIIGTVSAVYDFSELPGAYHGDVLALVSVSQVLHDCIDRTVNDADM